MFSFLLLLSLFQSGAPTSSIDLTSVIVKPATWRIVSSESGGAIGVWPHPASQVPVTLHLDSCTLKGEDLYVDIVIVNNRELEVQIPISLDSEPFDRKETVAFRELVLSLGTLVGDEGAFRADLGVQPVTLFGSSALPGTLRVIAPGGQLIVRLKTHVRPDHRDPDKLHAQIAGFEVSLSPDGEGYKEARTWIPTLFAISPTIDPGPKDKAK